MTGPKQPVPLPPAGQPRRHTKRGHIKAFYLTDTELEAIFTNLDEGMSYNDACHDVGTSHLQFQRAARRRPHMQERLMKIKTERSRHNPALLSAHEPPGTRTTDNDGAGVHKSGLPH